MSNNRPKVIVIGLDGATFKNLKPWMEQGILPNLKFLVDNGAHGELESTIPRLSSPAWTSFMTGVNPGKHGLFGFIKPFKDKRYKKELVTSQDIKAKTIFEILSEYEKTSGVINLPMTYPPFKINGFMISCGLTTPNADFTFTHPKDLFEKNGLDKSEYILDLNPRNYSEGKEEKLFSDLMKCTEKRKEISFKLLDAYDCDLFVLVFSETDRIHHFYWHCIDPTHSKFNPSEANKLLPLIIKYYQKLDSIIGNFINYMDDHTSLIVISDHGFGPFEKQVAFHKLLEQNGFLHLKKESFWNKICKIPYRIRGSLDRNSQIYRKTKEIIKSIYRFIRKRVFKKEISRENVRRRLGALPSDMWQKIDWKRTIAYKGLTEDSVYLNIKGREPEGVIDTDEEYLRVKKQIMDIVSNVYDPYQQRKLKVKVYEKDKIYSGPFLKKAPDICLEVEDSRYEVHGEISSKNIIEENTGQHTGKHTRDGILICYGKNFKRGHYVMDSKIIDIAPTILYLLKEKIPEYMDGKVLQDIFKEEFKKDNSVTFNEETQERNIAYAKEDVYSDKEEVKVKKHLEDLGYL